MVLLMVLTAGYMPLVLPLPALQLDGFSAVRFREETRPGTGYCTAEHRRCTYGRWQELDDPYVLVMVVVVAVVGLLILMPLARVLGSRVALQEV